MKLQFTPSREVEQIRKRIDHPIVDADGHLMEFFPLVLDLLKEEAGADVVARFQRYLGGAIDPDSSDFVPARVFWALPERNTLDRLTVTLPELLYRRPAESFDQLVHRHRRSSRELEPQPLANLVAITTVAPKDPRQRAVLQRDWFSKLHKGGRDDFRKGAHVVGRA